VKREADEPPHGDDHDPDVFRPWSTAPTDEYDTPAEVDATFRTLRRVAVGYFAVFVAGLVALPVLSVAVDWWSDGRLIGGMSPGFAMTALGLYVFFFAIALAAATLSTAVEDRMLGGPGHDDAGERGGPAE
jgi:hypothetical protein